MATRPAVTLRDAIVDDAPGLIALWSICMTEQNQVYETFAQQLLWREPDLDEANEALAEHLAQGRHRIIVAVDEAEEIVGAVVAEFSALTPINRSRVLVITALQVAPEYRRRSLGQLLLSTIAAYAEEQGCEVMLACVPVQARESSRYLTKLGFNQLAVLRAVQTSRLRARLDDKVAHAKGTGRLLAVRRTLRRRQKAPVRH